MTAASESIALAIDTLEKIGRERGVDNGWLWEIPEGVPHTGTGPDDPRVALVQGGPDVVLQLCVPPMLAILREPLRVHVHVWIHVASHDWLGRPALVCKCSCGDKLTPAQIVKMRAAAGVL